LLREIRDQTFAEFWRELAKLITLFDEHSPSIFSERESANSLGNGAPGRSRTCDPRLRRPSVLWPLANRGPDHWSGGPEVKVTSGHVSPLYGLEGPPSNSPEVAHDRLCHGRYGLGVATCPSGVNSRQTSRRRAPDWSRRR